MEAIEKKVSVLEAVYTLIKEYKTAFWGVVAPVVIGMAFWSLAAGLSVVCFASIMFASNGKLNQAKQVWINAGLVILSIAFFIIVGGALAGIAPRP